MSIGNTAYAARKVICHAGAITATANGKSIDADGADIVEFFYQFGTTTSGTSGTVTFTFEDSADNSSFAAVSGVTSGALTTDSGGMSAKTVSLSKPTAGLRRYVRVVLTVAGTVSTAATGPANAGGVLIASNRATSLVGATEYTGAFQAPQV